MNRIWKARFKKHKSYNSKNKRHAPPLAISEAHHSGLAIMYVLILLNNCVAQAKYLLMATSSQHAVTPPKGQEYCTEDESNNEKQDSDDEKPEEEEGKDDGEDKGSV
jgi:hypothetical protein